MPPARGSSEGSVGLKWALFTFIFLFLVMTIVAVMQFMKNEQLVTARKTAEDNLAEIANNSQLNTAKNLVVRQGARIQQTAFGKAAADMRYMAQLITGEEVANVDLGGLRDYVERAVDPRGQGSQGDQISLNEVSGIVKAAMVYRGERGPLTDPQNSQTFNYLFTEGGRFIGLKKLVDDLAREIIRISEAYVTETASHERDKSDFAQTQQQLEARIAEMEQTLSKASTAAATNDAEYAAVRQELSNRYEQVIAERENQLTQIRSQLEEQTGQSQALQREAENMRNEIRQLRDRLKSLQPDPDQEMVALQPDGYIISVAAVDNLAYINLARNDHVFRGLTFEVYDSYVEIPRSGQGKGTLEIVEILDNISKCRIVKSDPTNPIMQNDIVANLIWSKDKVYNFCVAGDFDFDGDGRIDSDGRNRIISLIEQWGGKTTSTLSVDTDFLVMGHPPEMPPRPAVVELDSSTPAARAYRQAEQLKKDYNQVRDNAAELGVPTFNRERFLHFIGFYQQAMSPLNF